jgi:hypothetical protein
MANFLPRLIIGQALVREACQAEARVRNADRLSFVRHHLSGDIDQLALMLGNQFACPFLPMQQYETVNSSCCVVVHVLALAAFLYASFSTRIPACVNCGVKRG